ncbi:hypothetical protein VE00_10926 [Pseudogymnoascus sp. WSF 3629]|nr:hypothetical protein VE00_10926 [Pseudogymnoascus sp. WSF 3629]
MASPVCYASESYFLGGAPLPPSTTSFTSPSSLPVPAGTILSLSLSPTHTFSKPPLPRLTLIPGLGVEGDCHLGADIQHLSRRAVRPLPENLRQVHLMSGEFLEGLVIREMGEEGKAGEEEGEGGRKRRKVKPGDLGENITTTGIDLEGLSRGTILRFSSSPTASDGDARIRITGLRNPCHQIEKFGKGLLGQCTVREGGVVVQRKAGVMGVVLTGGVVERGMSVWVEVEGEGALDVV